jgi:type I restriction enzyme S subunit
MKAKSVPSSWLQRDGRRLDGGPYMSGALEAKVLLEQLKVKKERLADLTAGYKGGIYNGPQFKRNYVDSAEHGVPFLTGGDVLSADLRRLPYLSRRDAYSSKLNYLRLEPGMTIISCSGAIGRMAYVREDMAGVWSSQDVMKVVPDPEKIPPGYLYAYLSSKFGVPLVVGGTYGAIIQHIEPEHIADLPVPRLGAAFEAKVHELVERAAKLRSEAAQLLIDATIELEKLVQLPHLEVPASATPFGTCAVSSSALQARLDGFFHSRFHSDALTALARSQTTTLAEISSGIVEPLRFKRVAVDDPAFGVPFFGTSPLFWADPTPNYFVSRKMRNIEQYLVDKKCLLIPRSGQLSGIIGSVVLPYGDIVGGAVSEDAIRVYFESEQDAGFGLVALTSEYGRRQLKARAFGSSIPHLDVKHIGLVRVPDPGLEKRKRIGAKGARVAELRDEACSVERQARAMLEAKIEKGATS